MDGSRLDALHIGRVVRTDQLSRESPWDDRHYAGVILLSTAPPSAAAKVAGANANIPTITTMAIRAIFANTRFFTILSPF